MIKRRKMRLNGVWRRVGQNRVYELKNEKKYITHNVVPFTLVPMLDMQELRSLGFVLYNLFSWFLARRKIRIRLKNILFSYSGFRKTYGVSKDLIKLRAYFDKVA